MPWRKPTGTTTQRGYGKAHQKQREQAAQRHHPGNPCARCKHPLGPMGPWLHYDHNDQRTGYLGFSHGDYPCMVCGHRCNRRAGAKKAQRVWEANKARAVKRAVKINTNSSEPALDTSRQW